MAPITFDLDFEVDYGRVDEVAPGLRRVVANNPSRFTFRGTGTYIFGSGNLGSGNLGSEPAGSLAVVDPGPDLSSHLDALTDAIGDSRLTHIFVTHTHNDHSPLARRLSELTGAVTYGFGPHGDVPPPDPEDRIDFGPDQLGSEGDAAHDDGRERTEHHDGGFDAEFTPDVLVRHGDVIVGDGWTIDCIHTPGHTSNHMCFGWREQRALFSGDHVMGWSTSVIGPPDGQMATYLASLELLLDRDYEVYWPTHGHPIRNPREHVAAFIEHRKAREEAIVGHLGRGVSTVEQLVREIYQHVSPKLYPAAASSVHAHLIHLVAMGRAASSTDRVRLTDTYSPP